MDYPPSSERKRVTYGMDQLCFLLVCFWSSVYTLLPESLLGRIMIPSRSGLFWHGKRSHGIESTFGRVTWVREEKQLYLVDAIRLLGNVPGPVSRESVGIW